MNTDGKEKVISALVDYPNIMRKISVLRYELEHPVSVTPEDMLDVMNYAHGEGTGSSGGNISNKTLYIAMNYKYAADQAKVETVDQILNRLLPLEQKIKRIDYYLGLLSKDEEAAVRRFYIEKQRATDIAEALNTTVWSVRRLRDRAIEKLAEMISFAEGGDLE